MTTFFKRVIRGCLLALVLIGLTAAVALVLGGRGGDRASRLTVPVTPELVAQGAYLAQVGDCTACHTAPGGASFAGGLGIQSPIGVIFSTNITPDPKTGIGSYTYGDFERAVRRGILRSGQTEYPAMPYPSFSRITDADMAALYAYFMHGVAPISRKNKAEQIVWPLSMRWPLVYWRWLFTPQVRPFAPGVGENPTVARGAYLVEGLGHCGACHTPRALTMQEEALTPQDGPEFLDGSQFNDWFAPSLRGHGNVGLGRWAGANIEEFLKLGRTAKYAAFGEMGDVVLHSTQFMTTADRAAIASFLKTLAVASGAQAETAAVANPSTAATVHAGEQVYRDNCAACHQTSGTGIPSAFPALAGNPIVNAKNAVSVIHIVLAGDAEVHTHGGRPPLVMPPFGADLTDSDIANLLTYVRSSWGNRAPAVSSAQVKTLRAAIGEPEPGAK